MRKRHELSGAWYFKIDEYDIGEKDLWYESGLKEPMQVEVPHIWQREEEYVEYCGTAWYQKDFTVPEVHKNKRVYLYFGAVDFHAMVWLNGKFIGEHEGGFTPFEFDVTNELKSGAPNRLVVRVYDPQDNAEIPIGKQGSWYTRVSGIWQDVYLELRSACHIEHVYVRPDIDEGTIETELAITGDDVRDATIEYVIAEHGNEKNVVTTYQDKITSHKAVISVPDFKLWEPDNPNLYDLVVSIKKDGKLVDQYQTYFGMRKVDYVDGIIRLNNKPLYIRGALDQAFYPDTIFTAPSDEWIKKEINMAKEMGFNLLRKHIKVEVPRYLYWADRMGMLIWAEPPNVVKWSNQSNRRFYNELVSMIKRDYNHPSIIIWSLYNEEWGLEWDLANDVEKQNYLVQMYKDIKKLDSSRLICDNSGWTHVKTDVNDYHRYFTLPEQINEWRDDIDGYMIKNPDKNFVGGYKSDGEPIIVSEFGVWGLPDINKIIEYYEGHPTWFKNLGDETHSEDFKKPLVLFENFEKYQLNRVFGNYANLAAHSQKRMFRACQSLIEEMRKRPEINGYVVTEFTDIEWETNGWLDETRNFKAGFKDAADFNGDLIVMVNKMERNLLSGDEQALDIIISNHNMKDIAGVIEWEITDTDLSGSIDIQKGNDIHIEVPNAIAFTVPDVEKPAMHELKLRLVIDGELTAKNSLELTFSPREKVNGIPVYAYHLSEDFTRRLTNHGFEAVDRFEESNVVITNRLDKSVMDFYRQGGHVIFLAEEGDHLSEKGHFTFRELDSGESWNRTSSMNYVDTDYFKNVPLNKEMGWELEGIHPHYVIPFSDYNKLGGTVGRVVYMFGNDRISKTSKIISGYFQGWVGQVGGSLIEQTNHKGSLIVTTWRLLETYGVHPIATQIVHELITKCSKRAEK